MTPPPMGKRPWRLPTWRRLPYPHGRPTPLHSAVAIAAQHMRQRLRYSQRGRASERRIELRLICPVAQARREARLWQAPTPLSPRRAGAVARRHPWPRAPVVTAAEPQALLPQARLLRARSRAALHAADDACRAGARGVAFPGSRWRGRPRRLGFRLSGPRLLRKQSAPSAARGPMRLQGSARAPFGATCRCS
jgi:hypothetical protein